jgi:glycosyltransferase involved in cell wall biosynthesis
MSSKISLKNTNSKPIRVLQVFTSLGRAGAESMIMNYYRSVDKTKVQFDFLVHREEEGAFEEEIRNLGGTIYRVPKITNHFKYRKELLSFLKKNDYKIIHSHIDSYSYWILKYAKKYHVPVRIIHSHIAVNISIKKMFLSKSDFVRGLKSISQYVLKFGIKKHATHFFACGEKAGEYMYGKNSTDFSIIRNAINLNDFKLNLGKRRALRNQLEIGENEFVIGHIGRFAIQKNHIFLIHIFKEILKLHENCTLILVGDGDLKTKMIQEVEKLGIQSKVNFLGVRKDVANLLQAFDLFLFPSIFEGLPVTMVEAQVSGLPIVASAAITKEVNITDLASYIDLKESHTEWAQVALEKMKSIKRYDRTEEIIANGYDIKTNAEKLQDFYLHQIQSI